MLQQRCTLERGRNATKKIGARLIWEYKVPGSDRTSVATPELVDDCFHKATKVSDVQKNNYITNCVRRRVTRSCEKLILTRILSDHALALRLQIELGVSKK